MAQAAVNISYKKWTKEITEINYGQRNGWSSFTDKQGKQMLTCGQIPKSSLYRFLHVGLCSHTQVKAPVLTPRPSTMGKKEQSEHAHYHSPLYLIEALSK